MIRVRPYARAVKLDRYRSLVLLGMLVHGLFAVAQGGLNQGNGDCTGAIFISDSIYHQASAVRGFGNKLEIKENPSEDLQWFEREHHSTWYKFRSPANTIITFDIIPDNIDDDIDFLVFRGAVPGICDKLAAKEVAPVRSNISRNDKANGSICGLKKDAPDEFVRSGVGSSFSKGMDVTQGELLYLVIDYQDRPLAGYTIRFHYDPPPPPPEPEKEEKPQQELNITVVDAKTGKPIDANLTIDGMRFDEVVEAKGKSSYTYKMDVYRNLKIGCVRAGYMFQSTKVKGSTDPVVNVELKLTPIGAGERVILDDIRFVGNEDKVMRQSEAALLLLLRFMQLNPKVRIEIEGHVNGPTFKNTKEFINLSTSRAKTVYDFLLVNEVEPERLSYVGMGNSKMLYPSPKNKEESEANRRVEINVLGN
ncbi:MAG TPA: OmpA family protein [Flavobacteriales bacterium]|nr:OmpA family protein [Flavobacteriales bacterium]